MCLVHRSLVFLVAISYLKGTRSSVELTPVTASVCPGERVTLKCIVTTSSAILQWNLRMDNNSIPPLELLLSPANNKSENRIPSTNLVLHAELISLSPPCSTFTTNATLALHNAQVSCTSGDSHATSTITLRGIEGHCT